MFRVDPRAVRFTVALMIPALQACADQASTTAPIPPRQPNLGIGAIVTVTNTSGGTNTGSLRWAAAQTGDYGVIQFDPSLAGATITLDSTLRIAQSGVTIQGPQNRGITISGGGKVRVLHIHDGARLVNLNIKEGSDSVLGAGILSNGLLLVENTALFDNRAPNAAGMYAEGDITFINSTVAGNIATGIGSGLAYTNGSTIRLINTTVTRNGPAPGIASHYRANLTPTVVLRNSIIAGNQQNCYVMTGFVYEGRNLSDDTSCGYANHLLIADAKLGELRDNGGPSRTIDFAPQSPALNGATACDVSVDQRYVPRDSKCDIGAFEFTAFTAVTINIDQNASFDSQNGSTTVSGTVKCSRAESFALTVQLKQEQKDGRTSTVVQANGGVDVTCPTSGQPWRVTLTPASGAFVNGSAIATVATTGTPDWVAPATRASSVKLGRGRK